MVDRAAYKQGFVRAVLCSPSENITETHTSCASAAVIRRPYTYNPLRKFTYIKTLI